MKPHPKPAGPVQPKTLLAPTPGQLAAQAGSLLLAFAKQCLAHAANPPAAPAPVPPMPMGTPFPYGMPFPTVPMPGFDPTFGMFPGALLPPGMLPPGVLQGVDPNLLAVGMWFGDGSGW